MSRLLSLDAEFCRQLALVLFHVTWSGTLLAGAAALVARQASPRAPAVKYWIHFGALLGILLLAPFWGMRVRSLSPVDRQSSPVVTAVDLPALCEPATLSEPVALGIGASLPAATETAADGIFSPPQTTAAAPPPANRFNWHELALRVVTLCYLSGAMCMLLRLLAALGGGERLRLAGTPVRDVALIDLLAEQSRRLGLRAVPLLRICERTAVPVVVGALRPAILIPATMITGLDPGQLAGVLMHELAHIRRYDHLFLLLQRFIEAVLFFHPAVWYLSRCVHADREDCCDDLVLAGGGDPLEYAGALVRVAELRLRPTRVVRPAGALAADGHRPSDLRRRIARVLGVEPQPVVRLPKAGLLALLLPAVAGTAVACAQLAAAPQSGSPRSGTDDRGGQRPADADSVAGQSEKTPDLGPERSEPARNGTLTGRFVYGGAPPAPKQVDFSPPKPGADGRVAGTKADNDYFRPFKVFDESLKVGADGGVENIVIWIQSANLVVERIEKKLIAVTITARDGRFVPHVVPFHAPRIVVFKNEAEVAHDFHVSASESINVLVAAREQASILIDRDEKLPVTLSDDIHPWMKAYLLPLKHPYAAVTSATGEFRIEHIPPGEWEIAFWHERCGYVKSGATPSGRMTVKIGTAEIDLGTIRLAPELFEKHSAAGPVPGAAESDSTKPAAPHTEGWFWPDPYPGLGHVEGARDGYQYLRIAADSEAGKDLRTTAAQQSALQDLYWATARREPELAKQLVREGLDEEQRKRRLAEQWEQARHTARAILSEAQDRRVEQLLLQRLSYNAFRRDDVARKLELTDRQREQIAAAITAHLRRIRDNEAELGRAVERLGGHAKRNPVLIRQPNGVFREQKEPAGTEVVDESAGRDAASRDGDRETRLGNEDRVETLEQVVRRLTAVKARKGRLSHRQVWDEIHDILVPAQRDQFNALRGPMPERVRDELHHFEPETADSPGAPATRDKSAGAATSKTLTITITADADGHVASLTVGLAKLFDGPLDDNRLRQLDKRLKDVFAIEGTFDGVVLRVGKSLKYEELIKVINVCTVQKMADGNPVKKISFVEFGDR